MLTGENLGLTYINTISQGHHELFLNADPYAAMMGLLKLKQQGRSVLTDGVVQSSDDDPTPQPRGNQRSQSVVMDGPSDSPEICIW